MIIAENLVKIYPNGVKALEGISFRIEPGEVCAYLGSNGAGKSTTIKILCGMLSASSGTASVCGFNTAEQPNEVKRRIGYVPESGELFLSLAPFDFLEFVCRMYDIEKDVYTHRIFSFLELFGLKNEARTPMFEFSKGMRQKVLIISSLIHNPEVIFWDEPMSGIDYSTTLVIRNLVSELAKGGKTIFYSTHIVESVEKVSSRVILLNQGKISFDGQLNGESPEQIIKKYGGTGEHGKELEGLYQNKPRQ